MTLTRGNGPISPRPHETVNYAIDGPAHKLLLHPFPRRIRAVIEGRTVIDSTDARLLHETALLPQIYVPEADLDTELLVDTEHSTHCPFKGDATYRSVRVGERIAENAIWTYREPTEAAFWLEGLSGVYWDRFDAWYDEDEEVRGHLRDPYHRVDAVRSSRHVRVRLGEETIAESERPLLVSETGLPNRFYLDPDDVRTELLRRSERRTTCPYKGDAEYWSVGIGDAGAEDVAFSYPRPLPDATRIADRICFEPGEVVIEVDGVPVED